MAHTGFDQTVREFGRIDTNVIKSHSKSYLNLKFINIPISMFIKNISSYFPKLEIFDIEPFNI